MDSRLLSTLPYGLEQQELSPRGRFNQPLQLPTTLRSYKSSADGQCTATNTSTSQLIDKATMAALFRLPYDSW